MRLNCRFKRLLIAAALTLGFHGTAHAAPAPPESALDVPIVMLVDLTSGQVLFERNADRRFVPASITKVMTAYQAFEMIDAGELDLGQTFSFSRSSFAQWGGEGSTMFLNAGDRTRVSDLLLGITTVSANDAAIVLAEGAGGTLAGWLAGMNATSMRLGMHNSHFGTPNGWPDEGHTFTTARDLVKLGTALVQDHPDKYRRFFGHREFTYRGITQPNHEPLTGRVAGGDGIKTGFTNEAGFGLIGSAERNGRRLMVVVGGADRRGKRNRAARELIDWGYSAFDSRRLFSPSEIVGYARVQGGSSRTVPLSSPRFVTAAYAAGGNPAEIKLKIVYDGPIRAPIAAGEQVAELEIKVGEAEPSRVPLYAAEKVSEAGPLARIVNGVIGWFS